MGKTSGEMALEKALLQEMIPMVEAERLLQRARAERLLQKARRAIRRALAWMRKVDGTSVASLSLSEKPLLGLTDDASVYVAVDAWMEGEPSLLLLGVGALRKRIVELEVAMVEAKLYRLMQGEIARRRETSDEGISSSFDTNKEKL